MIFFFGDHRLTEEKITKTITVTAGLACFFGNHGEAQTDLSMTIDGRPNTVLMLGLDCLSMAQWINFANFWLFFNRQALCYFGLVFRYHFRWKLEENLATLLRSQFGFLFACTEAVCMIDLDTVVFSRNKSL